MLHKAAHSVGRVCAPRRRAGIRDIQPPAVLAQDHLIGVVALPPRRRLAADKGDETRAGVLFENGAKVELVLPVVVYVFAVPAPTGVPQFTQLNKKEIKSEMQEIIKFLTRPIIGLLQAAKAWLHGRAVHRNTWNIPDHYALYMHVGDSFARWRITVTLAPTITLHQLQL